MGNRKSIAIYPGTFDPLTNGHLDLVERGRGIFDEIIVAVGDNPKKLPLFTLGERIAMIKEAISNCGESITVEPFTGLLVEYASSRGAVAIIRGLRAVSDFEYEMQMALMNRRLNSKIETVFMMPSEEYSYLTSTIVKEVAVLGGSVSGLVPENVRAALVNKLRK